MVVVVSAFRSAAAVVAPVSVSSMMSRGVVGGAGGVVGGGDALRGMLVCRAAFVSRAPDRVSDNLNEIQCPKCAQLNRTTAVARRKTALYPAKRTLAAAADDDRATSPPASVSARA